MTLVARFVGQRRLAGARGCRPWPLRFMTSEQRYAQTARHHREAGRRRALPGAETCSVPPTLILAPALLCRIAVAGFHGETQVRVAIFAGLDLGVAAGLAEEAQPIVMLASAYRSVGRRARQRDGVFRRSQCAAAHGMRSAFPGSSVMSPVQSPADKVRSVTAWPRSSVPLYPAMMRRLRSMHELLYLLYLRQMPFRLTLQTLHIPNVSAFGRIKIRAFDQTGIYP
jgi:hypothetical protein